MEYTSKQFNKGRCYNSMHHINPLSLYSTATQNHLHWVLTQFCVGYTNIPTCWYLFFSMPNLKIASPPTATPNASQWNIGCVGSPTQNFCIGHVHFMLFVLISFALVTQREPSLQWNMDFRPRRFLFCMLYFPMIF